MVEFVYARHDFIPEHDDEVSFHAGDRIEVLEKDEQYADGWWLGRNLAGKVGLFPQTYTQPVPPSAEPPPAALSTLAPPVQAEDAPSPTSSLPNPMTATFQSLPKDSDLSPTANDVQPNLFASKSNGEVMLATMTDVQKAIEQLGHNDDFDGSRSFTFSSTRGESTDHDTDAEADGEDWHKGARQKLAEKAKKAAEMQAIRDAENGRVPMRSTVPPIDVEMSEDSGDEDEHPLHDLSPNGRTRRHSHIPEVDEEDPVPPQTQDRPPIPDSSSIQPSSHYLVPSPLQPAPEFSQDRATESDVPTATQSLFPQNLMPHTPENNNSSLPTPVSPNLRGISNGVTAGSNDATHHVPSAQLPFPSKSHHQTLSLQEAAGILPSPAASFTGHRPGYSISSINSSARVNASSPLSGVRSADLSAKKPRHVHPTDWTVEEVVDWLRSKGFDDAVCEKFIEQEITGDVLLELDVAVLKSEIGITAYGKRMRIWNAITELRRPPSLMSSSAEQLTRGGSFSQRSAPLQHGKTPSSSLMISTGSNIPVSPESPNSGDMAAASLMPLRRDSDPGVRSPIVSNATDSNATIGLGIGIPPSLIPGNAQSKAAKGKPSHLSLSPSDGALAASAKGTVEQEQGDKDRGVLSDSDTKSFVTKGRGSRLFRRHNSSSSTGKISSPQRSKEATSPRSDISPRSDGARPRPQPRKRSLDATREGSRLSIFGNTFVGTLGKARKPPPRYPTPDGETSPDRGTLSLSRLYHGSGSRKSSSVRSSPLDVVPSHGKEDKREKRESKDSSGKKDSLLRKRISSASDGSPTSSRADPGSLKAGQSILEQIGTPEHMGWMRKKGEHYNTWKNRYFVLKGPHLYWLKSDNPSETKIKGYINIVGYRIIADENVDPGRYGCKLVHESDRSHFFSSDDHATIREWMKALMKATIDRDYNKPVVSSVNVPTIPLAVAQAMNPAPRPPSPGARAATQRAMRRENTNQLSTRDAEILMGGISSPVLPYLHDSDNGRRRLESFFNNEFPAVDPISPSRSPTLLSPPVRPPRELRRSASTSEVRIAP